MANKPSYTISLKLTVASGNAVADLIEDELEDMDENSQEYRTLDKALKEIERAMRSLDARRERMGLD